MVKPNTRHNNTINIINKSDQDIRSLNELSVITTDDNKMMMLQTVQQATSLAMRRENTNNNNNNATVISRSESLNHRQHERPDAVIDSTGGDPKWLNKCKSNKLKRRHSIASKQRSASSTGIQNVPPVATTEATITTSNPVVQQASIMNRSSSSSICHPAVVKSISSYNSTSSNSPVTLNKLALKTTTSQQQLKDDTSSGRRTQSVASSSDSLNLSDFRRASSSNNSDRSHTTTASIKDAINIFNGDIIIDDDIIDIDIDIGIENDDDDHTSNRHHQSQILTSHNKKQLQLESSQQFEIIWRQLTYKVPKRFSERFADSIQKYTHLISNKLTASKQQQQQQDLGDPFVLVVNSDKQHQHQHQVNTKDTKDNKQTFPSTDNGETTGAPALTNTNITKNNTSSKVDDSYQARRTIFSDLNGCIRSGELTAILGPSGAGKTTFLKCLTNKIGEGMDGSIEVSGGSDERHRLKLCMIPQQDYLLEHLTVLENLTFASRIKNTTADFDHAANVDRVVEMLRLKGCLHLRTNKISGGQHKRVSIAQELLSNPDVLILDEPTSGLDSFNCFHTVSVLQDLVNLSRKGIILPLAVVMTIHQPENKIFNLFHHVYILSSMGQCIYEGAPLMLAPTIGQCCKSLMAESLIAISADSNAASFIIEIASEEYGQQPIEALASVQRDNFFAHHHHHQSDTSAAATTTTTKSTTLAESSAPTELGAGIVAASGSMMQSTTASLDGASDDGSEADHHSSSASSGISCASTTTITTATTNGITSASTVATTSPVLRVSRRLKWRRYNNHNGTFWLHVRLLTCRTWLSMWRDPLLTGTRILFHLVIPFIMAVIYSSKSGSANACPYIEREFDFTQMGSDETMQRMQHQHNELILTFENTSLFFVLLYSFSMCVLALTALSFPLNMHILMKETGNGWYSSGRFVMAKTMADLPLELTMPLLTMTLLYPMTNQPVSYLNWRMFAMTLVMTLCSLISQTQGLIFGATFMNDVKTAVFTSQAASLPWILLSGFTTRVSELPPLLQVMSFGSIYRLGIESILSIRYGFGMCPCQEQDLMQTPDRPIQIVGIPQQLRSLMNYYMEQSRQQATDSTMQQQQQQPVIANNNNNLLLDGNHSGHPVVAMQQLNATSITTTQPPPSPGGEDMFELLAKQLARANTYGVDIKSCQDVQPYILNAREIDESTLTRFLVALLMIVLVFKVLLFVLVRFKVNQR